VCKSYGGYLGKANGGTISDGTTSTEFVNFAQLQGGSKVDTVTVSAGGVESIKLGGDADIFISTGGLVTNVDGEAGADTFTLDDIANIGLINGGAESDTLTLNGTEQVVKLGTNVTLVENINATAGKLVAQDIDNSWEVTSSNSGTLKNTTEGVVTFIGFSDLVGGALDDSFTVDSFDYFTSIDGGKHVVGDSVFINANNQTVIIGENLFNIETITAAKGGTNVLQGDDIETLWEVTDYGKGSISYFSDGETKNISFTNFTDLQGGALDDTFKLSLMDHISGIIDGGDHVKGDLIELSTDNQIVKLGSDIDNIEVITASGGRNSLFAKNDINTWDINALNGGEVNNIAFSNFTDLVGGELVDTFTVSANGAVDGIINAGNGADELIVKLNSENRTQSGVINFVGGDDGAEDSVSIQGVTGDKLAFSETYQANVLVESLQFDQLSYENSFTQANVQVNFREVSSVDDAIQTSSLVINNAGADDVLYVNENAFSTKSGLVDISYASKDKGNVTLQAFDNSSIELNGDVTVAGDLTVTANTVKQDQGTIFADRIIFDNASSVGSNKAIDTNVDELLVRNHSGEIYLSQTGDLLISAIDNTTGLIDVSALSGLIESDANLNSSGDLTLESAEIKFTGFNNLAGKLDLTADDIVINNDSITNLVGIKAKNVSVTSNGDINATGDINVSANGNGSALFTSSNGSISLAGNNIIDSLNVNASNDILLSDLTTSNLVAETQNGDIVAAGSLDISQYFDAITTKLTARNGDISLLNDSNNFNKISLTANNAQIVDRNDLSLLDSSLTNNLTVNANGRLALGTITAGESMYLDAGVGNITSEKSDLTASEIILRATTGIGSGNYDNLVGSSADMSGAINMTASTLSAINNNSGIINLSNSKDVVINDLRNGGDIVLSNIGDMTLQTTQLEGGVNGQMKGAIDANYGYPTENPVYPGRVAILTDKANSVYTTGLGFAEADITAESLLVRSVLNFGKASQPIRLRVNDDFTLLGSFGAPFYIGERPRNITTTADIIEININGLSGQQLIEVESLSEVDPAIFAEVRNYNVDDVSLLMPRDQRFDEEDEEEDEEESILQ
ncbi:hypothetical protein CW745_15365, partial [Psychromonas sp. psych-6C06]|uniref:beta strand repeat-containing protein n=1 Tax=Psychromonas sp. psych-6C06 TaxID=2058089 RepID=UPI000CA9A518